MDRNETGAGARPPHIFDRRRRRLARARGAKRFAAHDFLHRRVMADIIDRLETVTRNFPRALFIGAGDLADMATPACGIGDIIHMDASPARLGPAGMRIAAEEDELPIEPASLDLIVSILTLHSVNDVLGALIQARQALKPDGLFLAAVFAEGTLQHFRKRLQQAEIDQTGALSARFAPLAAIQDYGQALSRAGFALPVTDIDIVDVQYKDPRKLVGDLRGMGETGALASRPAPLRRETAAAALAGFANAGGSETFSIAYLTGWAPAASQPKPLKPGSASASLEDAVKKFQA